ncbi:MAG: hypothetical protein ACRCTW_01270 [Lactococcus garvieae]
MKWFFYLSMLFSGSAFGESVDCTKAATAIEHLICGDIHLSTLDKTLNSIYKHVSNNNSEVKDEQLQWWQGIHMMRLDIDEIKHAYRNRINYLLLYSDDTTHPDKDKMDSALSTTFSNRNEKERNSSFKVLSDGDVGGLAGSEVKSDQFKLIEIENENENNERKSGGIIFIIAMFLGLAWLFRGSSSN